MNCKYCKKEIPDGSCFCPECGKKIKINYNDWLKKNKKIVIIFLIIIILILGLRLYNESQYDNGYSNDVKNATTDFGLNTCELNEYGFWVDSNILDEKYNQNGDLTYCKYTNGIDVYEENYDYRYDSDGKVKKIKYNGENDFKSELEIDYDDINRISKISVKTDYTGMIVKDYYNYTYNENYIKIDLEKETTIQGVKYTDDTLDRFYYVYDKNIDGKNYELVVYKENGFTNKNLDVYKQKVESTYSNKEKVIIFEKNDAGYKNSLMMLGILPAQYYKVPHYSTFAKLLIDGSGFGLFEPVNINSKKILLKLENEYSADYSSKKRKTF